MKACIINIFPKLTIMGVFMKKSKLIFLSLIVINGSLFATKIPEQIAWSVLNVKGYAIDPTTGKVDDTEGYGAFDSIMAMFKPSCPKNFDNAVAHSMITVSM